MEILTIDINKKTQTDLFFKVAENVYQNDPYYINEDKDSILADIKKNIQHHEILILAVSDKDIPVSRALFYKKKNSDNGCFGFFESLNNEGYFFNLLNTGIEWLRSLGCKTITGPMNFDTWHSYRFNCGPSKKPPFLMEPYNNHYYCGLAEKYGFELSDLYCSKTAKLQKDVLSFYKKAYDNALKNGFSFKKLDKGNFTSELSKIYDLSIKIFSNNPYYQMIEKKDFFNLYTKSKPVLQKDLVWFALDENKQYCGFIFAFPDYFKAVLKMKGKKGLKEKIIFLLNRSSADTVNVKTLGIEEKYRGEKLASALLYKVYEKSIYHGFKRVNHCLMHEDNDSLKFQPEKNSVFREYKLYKKKI